MILDFLKDVGNYSDRKVARDEVDGLTISTAFTSDEGFETAVIDKNGVHPVQRYGNREESIVGHQEWLKKIVGMTDITQLGAWEIVDPKEIKLER